VSVPQLVRRTVDFLLYSSLYIALCAIALCLETNLLLGIPFQPPRFYLFVGCATLLQYNLHYYIKTKEPARDARTAWSHRHRPVHKTLIVLSLAGILFSLFGFSARHLFIVGILGVLTALYSVPIPGKKRLKDFGLVKITVLTLTWTIITVWLPVAESGWDVEIWLIFIRRFLFMGALCLAFDIRDVHEDAPREIRTIPVRIGLPNTYRIIWLLLALFVLLSIFQFYNGGNVYHFNAMMLSALATYVVISASRNIENDYIYLGGIDGMMLLQFILVAVGS